MNNNRKRNNTSSDANKFRSAIVKVQRLEFAENAQISNNCMLEALQRVEKKITSEISKMRSEFVRVLKSIEDLREDILIADWVNSQRLDTIDKMHIDLVDALEKNASETRKDDINPCVNFFNF